MTKNTNNKRSNRERFASKINNDNPMNELLKIIRTLPILSSNELKKSNKCKKSLRNFREHLFEEELDNISKQLSNLSPNQLLILLELIKNFDRIKNEVKYVLKSLFKSHFRNTIEETLKSDDESYALIIEEAYRQFQSKLENVEECRKHFDYPDISGKTYLGLFTASFITSLILNLLTGKINFYEARRIIDTFEYDFIISYIFVSTRSHTVFEISIEKSSSKRVRELLNSLLELFNKPVELRRRYIQARNYLSEKEFPFDLKHPLIRRRKFFENEWTSLIMVAFRKGERRTLLRMDPYKGVKIETYFPASPFYFELAVSEKKDKLLLMMNMSPSRKQVDEVAKFIFAKILHIDISSISFQKYIDSLNPTQYKISSETLIKKLNQVLEGSPSTIVKNLKSFESLLKNDLSKATNTLPFTYKDDLKELSSTLKLAGVILEYKLGEHKILSISSELSPFIEQTHISANPDDVYTLIAKLIRTKTEIHKHIENLVERQDRIASNISLVFTSKLNQEKPAEIIITDKGNIHFFNMNREIITELSRLFQEVVEKWSKRK